jgi:hypothetical protein
MGSWLPSIYSTGTGVFGEPVLDRSLPAPEDPVRLSPIFHAQSEQVLEVVRKLGLEGVVGKRIDSVHEPGDRSGAWIKLRTNREQDFVIGGYIPGSHGFDALLVGVYENNELVFVAKVKDGFVPRIRDSSTQILYDSYIPILIAQLEWAEPVHKTQDIYSGPIESQDASSSIRSPAELVRHAHQRDASSASNGHTMWRLKSV